MGFCNLSVLLFGIEGVGIEFYFCSSRRHSFFGAARIPGWDGGTTIMIRAETACHNTTGLWERNGTRGFLHACIYIHHPRNNPILNNTSHAHKKSEAKLGEVFYYICFDAIFLVMWNGIDGALHMCMCGMFVDLI